MMNCVIEYNDNAELCAKLAAMLVDFGYVVKRPDNKKRITVGKLAKLVGRPTHSVSRSLRAPSCPPFVSVRGPKRILSIELTDDLLTFLRLGRK